jgi:hypothetical protein
MSQMYLSVSVELVNLLLCSIYLIDATEMVRCPPLQIKYFCDDGLKYLRPFVPRVRAGDQPFWSQLH